MAMIKMSTELKNMKGEALQADGGALTLGVAIANMLLTSSVAGKMKLFNLAQTAYAGGDVVWDQSDLELVKKIVEECKTANVLVSGQVLSMLADADVCAK